MDIPDGLLPDPVRPRAFRSAEQAAAIALFRTTDALRRHLSRAVEPHGITVQQFNVLRILKGAEPKGLPTLTVARRMVERTPGVTRLLDRLEADELVERVRDREDRRRVVARIAPAGERLLERVNRGFEEAEDGAFQKLSKSELEDLLEHLGRVRRHLDSLEDSDDEGDRRRRSR